MSREAQRRAARYLTSVLAHSAILAAVSRAARLNYSAHDDVIAIKASLENYGLKIVRDPSRREEFAKAAEYVRKVDRALAPNGGGNGERPTLTVKAPRVLKHNFIGW